jgi:hypothetical protein
MAAAPTPPLLHPADARRTFVYSALRKYWMWAVLSLALLLGSATATLPSSQMQALTDFYNAMNGDHWNTRSQPWLKTPNPCGDSGLYSSWVGVTCDPDQTTVVALALGSIQLAGSFPSSFSALTALTELVVRRCLSLCRRRLLYCVGRCSCRCRQWCRRPHVGRWTAVAAAR